MRTRNIAIGVGLGLAVALSMGQGQLGGGGMTRVVVSSDFAGSGLTSNPLDMSTAVTMPGTLETVGDIYSGAGLYSNDGIGIGDSKALDHSLIWGNTEIQEQIISTSLDTQQYSLWVNSAGEYAGNLRVGDFNSGGTFDTTAGARTSIAVNGESWPSKVGGNTLTSIGVRGYANGGGVDLSFWGERGTLKQDGNTILGDASSDSVTLTGTLSANGSSGSDSYVFTIDPVTHLPKWLAAASGGITNSAGANILMKSNGTNAVASLWSDDGTTTAYNTNKFTIASANGNTSVAGTLGATGLLTATAGGTTSADWTTTGAGDLVSGDDLTVADDATISDKLVCVGTADFRSAISNSTGVLSLSDDTTIGASTSSTLTATNGIVGATGNYDGTYAEFSEEFIQRAAMTSGQNTNWYTCFVSGTSSACGSNDPTSPAGRPGVQPYSTGTTTTGRASIGTDVNGLTPADGTYVARLVWRVPTLSTSSEGFAFVTGFGSTNTAVAQANGCFFAYDERNVLGANASNTHSLVATCCKASVCQSKLLDGSTVCDGSFTSVATTLSAGSFIETEVRMTSALAEFYADTGSGMTKRCQVTASANLPTAAVGWLVSVIKSVGTTARTVDLDYAQLRWTLAAVRSP